MLKGFFFVIAFLVALVLSFALITSPLGPSIEGTSYNVPHFLLCGNRTYRVNGEPTQELKNECVRLRKMFKQTT